MILLALMLALGEQIYFASYDARTYPKLLRQKMQVLTTIIGDNLTSALAFRNRDDANEVLASLKSEGSIRSAYLFDAEGMLLAEFVRQGEPLSVPMVSYPADTSYFDENALVIFRKIHLNEQNLGSLILSADLQELAARRDERLSIGAQVATVVTCLAAILAFFFQRMFTKPILNLAEIANHISKEKNYSLRAVKSTDDEFGILVESFNSMLDEIEQRDEALKRYVDLLERTNKELDQFVYAASHDLKAPLRAVDTLSNLISEETRAHLSPEKHELLDLMRGRIKRLEALIDDLLRYSRVGRERASSQRIDIGELLEGLVELLSPGEFHIKIGNNMPTVNTPRAPLEQVFRNLIGNAMKHHHRKDGRITITSRDLGNRVEFTVDDDGPGIPEQYHTRVFQMFQTLKSRDDIEGSGMGLALVKKIVENYGGKITLISSEGSGAAFAFTWPKQWPEQGERWSTEP